jgi:DNA polymerase-3 subunit alpha
MEMFNLFKDVPDSISNTQCIVDKIDNFSIEKDILLPIYNLPDGFSNQDDYLKKLAYDGALIKYNSIDSSIKERIDYELKIINLTKFPGYFLIVKDFIDAAKKLDVFVGPGRGSVTGSLVAYCIGITNIDPIKYNLIFERFLNPERISMPDIDIDFDDKGRQKIIDYVVEKYGKGRVAQIITFGSMAAKSSVKDVSRVLGLPVERANYIAKLIPDKPGTTLSQAFSYVPELLEIKKKVSSIECTVLNLAERLEGSIRHTGVHAAGIIISPYNLLDYFPLKTDKDSDLFVTQYDGSLSEKVGMLKMDFLGLKTLTIIKDTLFLINKNYNLKININEVDLEDEKTFNLYGIGNTIGTFQFESEGMRHWLPKLKPNNIDDLIAMNALYRPGPMKFIPNFIDRKNGKEEIKYQHPLLKPILSNTYGVMVYQEQIIKIAQIVAGYTLGQADLLRKAMSKKKAEEMTRQKVIFIKGAMKKHNILKEKSIEIFNLMERFSEYGFSLAHSTAYSVVAYHTAYLKANYTAAYMSSVLTNNNNDIDKLSIFISECRKNKIKILNPDVNESNFDFDINNRNEIRFGLCAIKGLGRPTAKSIIDLRNSLGDFLDIFDFVERSNLKLVSKKTIDSLVMSGAFDSFEHFHRREYLFSQKSQKSLIENSLLYGTKFQKEKISNQQSLFVTNNFFFKKPTISSCPPYSLLDKLNIEKETIGFYISNHPLDDFEIELKKFCNCSTLDFLNFKNKDIYIAGIVLDYVIRVSKNGNSFAFFTIEDFYGKINLSLFGDLFLKNKIFLKKGELLYISGFL